MMVTLRSLNLPLSICLLISMGSATATVSQSQQFKPHQKVEVNSNGRWHSLIPSNGQCKTCRLTPGFVCGTPCPQCECNSNRPRSYPFLAAKILSYEEETGYKIASQALKAGTKVLCHSRTTKSQQKPPAKGIIHRVHASEVDVIFDDDIHNFMYMHTIPREWVVERDLEYTEVKYVQPSAIRPYYSKEPHSVQHWERELVHWNDDIKKEKLIKSATQDKYNLALALLADGVVGVNTLDGGGNSPLHLAAWMGHVRMAELFLDWGANIEHATRMGNKPLHRAAYNGRTEMARFLLKRGANINGECRYGHTALFAAAHFGQLKTLKFLVGVAGTDPEVPDRTIQLDPWHTIPAADIRHMNDLGQTTLHVIAHKCLARDTDLKNIIHFLVANGCGLEETEDQAYTALHSACYFGRPDAIAILLAMGADTEAAGNHGFTPLLSAVLGLKPKCIADMLEAGAYWDVVSTGPETIMDVLARARKGLDDPDKVTPQERIEEMKAYSECEAILKRWTESDNEEMTLQYTLNKLLGVPKKNGCKEHGGWLQKENVSFPVLKIAKIIARIDRDTDRIVADHRPQGATTPAPAPIARPRSVLISPNCLTPVDRPAAAVSPPPSAVGAEDDTNTRRFAPESPTMPSSSDMDGATEEGSIAIDDLFTLAD